MQLVVSFIEEKKHRKEILKIYAQETKEINPLQTIYLVVEEVSIATLFEERLLPNNDNREKVEGKIK